MGWVVSAGALILLYYPLPTPEACTIIGCHPPTGSFLCVVLGNNLKKGGNELIPTHNLEKISNPTHNKRAAISPAAKSPTQVTTGLGWAWLGWAGYPGSEWFKYPLSCYFRRLKS